MAATSAKRRGSVMAKIERHQTPHVTTARETNIAAATRACANAAAAHHRMARIVFR